jgi:phosphotriesterase-related protein
MSERGTVQTVLGPVAPESLGHVQPHEHVLIDLCRPPARELPATARRAYYEPIRLNNYYALRRGNFNLYDRQLLDVDDAIAELSRYRELGGGTIVDVTSIGLGRDPEGLAHVARQSGVQIVMGAGYYVREFHPTYVADRDEAAHTAQIVADIVDGVDGTGIRAGLIGEVGLTGMGHPHELKVLRAAARAQRETGVALMIHPGRDEDAPFAALEVVEQAGGALDRVVMCHLDRTLLAIEPLRRLAATGCYLEFDLFGQESSYYAFADIDMPNDARRVDLLVALVDAGYRDQLLISQDIYRKAHLCRYGGEGYGHILANVLPVMRRKGLSEADIIAITKGNPARMLTTEGTA